MALPAANTAYEFYQPLRSQATGAIFQDNPTLAVGDVKVATDDGAPANIATLPVVDADFTKRVKVNLSASEMNGSKGVSILFSDASGDEWRDVHVYIPLGEIPAEITVINGVTIIGDGSGTPFNV